MGVFSRSGHRQQLDDDMKELYRARKFADDANCDAWEFAMSLRQLTKLGCSETELRWLVHEGLLGHAEEVTQHDDTHRVFRRLNNLSFSSATCFVLSETGLDLIEPGRYPGDLGLHAAGSADTAVPQWNPISRTLHVNNQLVKHFRRPAANQEKVLAAFEEESWPHRIYDPLPVQEDQPPKRRLADTIKCLNRKQVNERVRFHGDGTGEGVSWDFVG